MGIPFKNLPESVKSALRKQHPGLNGDKPSSGGKFGVKKCRVGNLVFDSPLERYFHETLTQHKIPFTFKPWFQQVESFPDPHNPGRTVRGSRFTIDFCVKDAGGTAWYIDTKGVVTEDYVLRWKNFVTTQSDRFFHIKTKKECTEVALLLRNNETLNNYAKKRFRPRPGNSTQYTRRRKKPSKR